MSKDILDQNRVLKLNSQWQPIEALSVRMAIKSMTKNHGWIFVCSGCKKEFTKDEYLKIPECTHCSAKVERIEDIPFMALHIDFPELDNGEIDFESPVSMLPVKWDDWIRLPIRPQDKFLRTSNSAVKVPTIIITENYGEIPLRTPQYSSMEVAKRDEFIDQYTGKFCPRHEGNIDHNIPRDLGGQTNWENCVWTSRKINALKANMHPDEFYKKHGYKLLKRPSRPSPRLKITNRYNIPEWDIFIKSKNEVR